jgi:hypothetical protein
MGDLIDSPNSGDEPADARKREFLLQCGKYLAFAPPTILAIIAVADNVFAQYSGGPTGP